MSHLGCWFPLPALLLTGCTVVLTPPSPPQEGRALFLLDHGRHSSLVLERDDGGLARYSYGDWRYYAEGEATWGVGFWALLRPTPAALGRRLLPGPADESSLRKQVAVGVERLFPLCAEAVAVDRLLGELDQLHQGEHSQRLFRPDYDLEFVPHPLPYTLQHNSNYVVGSWLQQLGVGVAGHPRLANWRVAEGESAMPCSTQ